VNVDELEQLFDRLWPLNRSLTGEPNRKTLEILSERIPLEITEVPSGTKCFDWEVPPEWNVSQAYIADENGKKLIDFKNNNLHLVGYSTPIDSVMSFEELDKHLHYLEAKPDWIPYITSYYSRTWGFCLSYNQYLCLDKTASYKVVIDSSLDDKGSMTIGQVDIKGQSDKMIFLSTYICHPSMANNELSGPLMASLLYENLASSNPYYSYRVPETIGSICYLSKYGNELKEKVVAGYVITTIGDLGPFNYKKSKLGASISDRAAELVLGRSNIEHAIHDFFPWGSDERQYCSPGFNLPIGSLMRTYYEDYDEYHTSADNKSFISFQGLLDGLELFLEILNLIQANATYLNLNSHCEPRLGKRNLFPSAENDLTEHHLEATMWLLSYSDGEHDLLSIIGKSKIDYKYFLEMAELLSEKKLLKRVT